MWGSMNQNVNLYLDEFQYHEPPFSGNFIVEVILRVFAIIAILFTLCLVVYGSLKGFNYILKVENKALIQKVIAVREQYPVKNLDTRLEVKAENIKKNLNNRRVLLAYLKNRKETFDLAADSSFAMKLMYIAQVKEPNSWIEKLTFNGHQVALSGKTVDYSILPRYAKALSASLVQEFRAFSVKPDAESSVWAFKFNTEVEAFDNEEIEKEIQRKSIGVEKIFGPVQRE